jgi:RNA polymerase sigma-70 factor, ECF subfamily
MDCRSIAAPAGSLDVDVLALLARGERAAAFELLVPRYEGKVYRLCWSLLRNDAQAADAAQDSLLRAWRALDRYDPGTAALSTWIYAITRNRCLSLLAERPRNTALLALPDVQAEAEAVAAPDDRRADEAAQHLRRCVQALPEAQRNALTLYYFEERSVSAAAAMLGWPEGTVKTHLHRGRAAVMKQLQAQGLADPRLWL